VPGIIDVLGMGAYSDSNIDVNYAPVSHRRQEYFYHQLNANNTVSDLYEWIWIEEYKSGYYDDTVGYSFLAKDPETFTYDEDGNLLSDGRWLFTWNAENRLVAMEETRTQKTIQFPRRKLLITYDDQGRRVRTEEGFWLEDSGGSYWYFPNGEPWCRHFVYSGWNLIAEGYSAPSTASWNVLNTYLWGLDLAERQDQRLTDGGSNIGRAAGGVGGLLMVTLAEPAGYSHNWRRSFVHHDANGNVVALIDADGSGELSATYDYDPFGNLIRASGDHAEHNPFRFSGKYHLDYYDLYYYGYRYYSPDTGRFLNRDPINERGSMLVRGEKKFNWDEELNLYAMVGNDPVNEVDFLGLSRCPKDTCDKWTIDLTASVAVVAVGGAVQVHGQLIPDSSCCMRRKSVNYVYTGLAAGVGARITFGFGSTKLDFETSCIGFNEHDGAGQFNTGGAGVIVTGQRIEIGTPQTYQEFWSWGWGFDWSLMASFGYWDAIASGIP
jgi:RHS repeat-associated protein